LFLNLDLPATQQARKLSILTAATSDQRGLIGFHGYYSPTLRRI
jgi:hypothetical protein